MENVSRKMETLRKDQREMLEFKKICNRNADVFSGLISTLDVVEERISELEDLSSETSQNEIQRGKKRMNKMKQNTQQLWNNFKRCTIYNWNTKRMERLKQEKYLK